MKQGWISLSCLFVLGHSYYFDKDQNPDHSKYSHFPESERIEMREAARQMFQFGYDNYMKYAFPMDELNPIDCEGRGPDIENRDNININDILGDYSLTLVDTLDTLAVMGNSTEFKRAALLVIEFVSFDKNNTVQVFEASIRVLGGLLAAHLLIIDKDQPFGDIRPHMYDGELLYMAHDLASRLLPAFEGTATGIPYPRVNLRHGVPYDCSNETCTAGAGTLLLEFGMLSLLLNDPVYESVAKRTLKKLYSLRSNVTGLVGNVVNIQTGQWTGHMSGLGAGLDSYFEYMLKSFIQFGDEEALEMFNESYESINYYLRKGRPQCNNGTGNPPIYVNVNMKNGDLANNWIDALQAAWTGVQVLAGDIEEAICSHAIYYAIWRKYDALPERFNWKLKAPDVLFYPLRPELVESTYLLYQATKNPFYLHVGRDILNSLNNHTKAECGYATVHDVHKKDLEDRMESFFLSETCKYLYLLFDKDNHVNKHYRNYLFTTEGHLFPLNKKYRKNSKTFKRKKQGDNSGDSTAGVQPKSTNTSLDCDRVSDERRYSLPMLSKYLAQLESAVGLT